MRRPVPSLTRLGLGGAIALLLGGLALFAYKGSAEIAVNTTTDSYQRAPAVAKDKAGNFVVVWQSWGQDGSDDGIIGRRFDAEGNPLSTEFVVNSLVLNNQTQPAVAMAEDGRFVVVWSSVVLSGLPSRILGRRFDKNGKALGPDFVVGTDAKYKQTRPDIGMDAKGNFVVVWETYKTDLTMTCVYGRRFNAAGKALGGEFRVNTTTKYDQDRPTIAVARLGHFLIAWDSNFQDGSSSGIYARRYNNKGRATTPEIQVNKYVKGYQERPAAAVAPDGSFVVAWESDGQDGSSYGIVARRLSIAGQIAGPEIRVNKYTNSVQNLADLRVDAMGNFVVVWQSYGQDGDNDGVFYRAFKKSGQPAGPDVQVNVYTRYTQGMPVIAMDASGSFVVAWRDGGQDGSVDGVYARVFRK